MILKWNDFCDIKSRYRTAAGCRRRILELRGPFVCPRCGSRRYGYLEKRGFYQCRECRLQTPVTINTPMYRSRMSLTKWFWAICMLQKDGTIRAFELASDRYLKLPYPSAWKVYHAIWNVLDRGTPELRELFQGIAKGVKPAEEIEREIFEQMREDPDDKSEPLEL